MISPAWSLPSLLRHDGVGRDGILAFQNRRLKALVSHAYEKVPYYRRLFDQAGLKPEDIQSVSDLHAMPVTSRKDLQALPPEEILARGIDSKRLVVRTTSGSSGAPLTIRRTRAEDRVLHGLRLRAWRRFGLRSTDRHVTITLTEQVREDQLLTRIVHALGAYRKRRIDARLAPDDIARRLRQMSPDAITGYAGVLARVAQSMSDQDRQTIRPRFIAAGAEVLTPLMRRQISEGFAAPVFEIYGSIEFNTIAWECKETRQLHACDDGLIVEVLRDGRPVAPGQQGELVGTNLNTFAMPFIRYRLGDMVTKGFAACPCGQPFSTIHSVQGRIIDYFPLPGGRLMHPYEIVVTLYKKAPWIRQYQLTQEREDRIVLRIVPHSRPSPQEVKLLEECARAILGPRVTFVVTLVPEIKAEPSGKFRASRTLVGSSREI